MSDEGLAPAEVEPRPAASAVWEITLRCNLKCIHCGSRAGPTSERELTTDEAPDASSSSPTSASPRSR